MFYEAKMLETVFSFLGWGGGELDVWLVKKTEMLYVIGFQWT